MRKNKSDSRLDWLNLRREWPLWILMAGTLVVGIIIYPHLPEQVPGHWNIHGEVDAYYPRSFGAFFAPLLTIGIYLLMLVLPLLDPRRDNYQRFSTAYMYTRWGLVLLLTVLHITTILFSLGYNIDVAMVVKSLVSVLLILIGNFMGQIRHNYFVGIKTPWTLANEEVWQRTHRVGGKIWVVGGLICLAMSFFSTVWAAYIFFAVIIIMAIVPIIYSYLLFNKLQIR